MISQNPNFMFREKELARIIDRLLEEQSVLLTGIRRTGKTELMKAVLAQLAALPEPQNSVFLDVQDYTSLTRFYGELLTQMPRDINDELRKNLTALRLVPSKLLSWISSHFGKVSAEGVEVEFRTGDDDLQRYWEPIVEQLAKILAKTPTAQLPIIAIDELPFFIENLRNKNYQAHDIEILLASLRKLRSNGLRFIMAGSINLECLLDSLAIPKTVLGGLWSEKLPAFTREEAEIYLQTRLQNTSANTPKIIELILQQLPDYIPECLATAVSYLKFAATLSECEQQLSNQVLPHLQRSFVYQFEERLASRYSTEEQTIAERILDTLARGDNEARQLPPELISGASRGVLIKLQLHDFLSPAADYRYRFSLNMIRLWWRTTRNLT